MKAAVGLLEPHMEQAATAGRTRVLLATVQGDVHDIGKNLVDIILGNNGYEVVNLGTNVPLDAIIEGAREHQVAAIGLSGLLVKSALAMQQSLPQLAAAGIEVPVLLGGAALTRRFVGESCAPGHPAPVVYCPDAFAGLRAIQQLEAGTLRATEYHPAPPATGVAGPAREEVIEPLETVPRPPFVGSRVVRDLDPRLLLPHLNREALFRGRWGFRQRKLTADEYAAVIEREARPALADLERRLAEEQLAQPQVAYGYFPCHADGERLIVEHDGREQVFDFPRQELPPHLCITDYFRSAAAGGDVAGFFVATIGEEIVEQARALFEADRYQDYLLLHGFAAELTDALAAYWHEVMTGDLGIGETRPGSGIRRRAQAGCRYGFGYSSCPDLAAHHPLFELLDPGRIGVTLTESLQLVPEVTTSAILAHHPQARYFAV
jgi:5-methyltetrahydrofolate--homocysteine methyltransferase